MILKKIFSLYSYFLEVTHFTKALLASNEYLQYILMEKLANNLLIIPILIRLLMLA